MIDGYGGGMGVERVGCWVDGFVDAWRISWIVCRLAFGVVPCGDQSLGVPDPLYGTCKLEDVLLLLWVDE